MFRAPENVETTFSVEQAENYVVSIVQAFKAMRIEKDLQLYACGSQACEHTFA